MSLRTLELYIILAWLLPLQISPNHHPSLLQTTRSRARNTGSDLLPTLHTTGIKSRPNMALLLAGSAGKSNPLANPTIPSNKIFF